MGRPREFDREVALMQAVNTFWQKGYAGTSVQDLVDTMGIHRASLYDTYGSKRALFREVMERYSDHVLETLYPPLDGAEPVLQRLRHFFQRMVDGFCGDMQQGCLAVKIMAAIDGEELPEARELAAGHVARIDERFQRLLEQAVAQGEIAADIDVPSAARFLRTSLNGLALAAAVRHDPNELRKTVDWVLRALV